MNKQVRQQKIREILHRREAGNQHDLLRLLDEAGIKVAQATLSRDCTELGIMRSKGVHGYRLVLPEENPGNIIKGLVEVEVLSIQANETAIIIKTLPGRAHGVGSFLDQLKNSPILGTIAGDDTLLVIPASVSQISQVISYIQDNLSKN
ncbi:MAG: arginine repressor [Chlorobi bacterium]|nr:arginine repressor [Chlorobiota bacterium]